MNPPTFPTFLPQETVQIVPSRLHGELDPTKIRILYLHDLPHDPDVQGEASPDVVRAPDGRYVVTYQSFPHDVRGGLSKLYYRTTTDFVHFGPARPLGLPLHQAPGDRMIDPALAWTPAGLLLGYKTGALDSTLAFEIARSKTGSIDGPWELERPVPWRLAERGDDGRVHLGHGASSSKFVGDTNQSSW